MLDLSTTPESFLLSFDKLNLNELVGAIKMGLLGSITKGSTTNSVT